MPKLSERHLVFGSLFFFAFWLLVALPFLYSVQRYSSHDEATNKCSAEESKNHGFWEKAGCDPTAYFTLWLVAFTGVLAVSTIGLWIVTWRAGSRQSRETQQSLAIAAKAADAADQSTRLLIAQQEPIIHIKDVSVQMPPNKLAVATIDLLNMGKSPAIILEYCIDFQTAKELPPVPRYNFIERSKPNSAIGPESSASFSISAQYRRITVADNARLESGEFRNFIFGYVNYATAKGGRFSVGFCNVYSLEGSRRSVSIGPEAYVYRRKIS